MPFNCGSNSCLALQDTNVTREEIFAVMYPKINGRQPILVPIDFGALGSILRKF
jgi:hypothetical protein